MLKSATQVVDGKKEPDKTEITSNSHEKKNAPTFSSSDQEKKNAPTSSSTDQDLDLFLLGDLGDSDEGPGTVPQFIDVCSVLKISDKEIMPLRNL